MDGQDVSPEKPENPEIPVKQEAPEAPKAASIWRILLFFLPLVLVSFSQSLTYPLVAGIVSSGPLGEQEFTAYSSGQQVLFFIGAIGGGLVTTGMVFAKSRKGLRNFVRMNILMASVCCALQLVTCLPGVHPVIFRDILGLEEDLARIGRWSLMACIPVQYNFFIRNTYLAVLYNAHRSGRTNLAILARIALATLFAWLFPKPGIGMVGYLWGAVALTIPCVVETVITWWMARPFMRTLPEDDPDGRPIASSFRQLLFTLPLSMGSVLLSASGFAVMGFISRSSDPRAFRPIHLCAMGFANPLSFAALRMQTVVIAYPPERHGRRRLFLFAVIAGVLLACVNLGAGCIPSLSRWFFVVYQHLPETSLPLARRALYLAAVLPVVYTLRGHADGLAMLRLRPNAVMAGQAMYFATILCTLWALMHIFTAAPGYLWGVIALAVAGVSSFATVHIGLLGSQFVDQFGAAAAHRRRSQERGE